MKINITHSLYFLMLLLNVNSFSQNIARKKKGDPTLPSFTYERPSNCALNTSLLMMDIKQNKDFKYLKERFSLTEINSELYVDAFIKIGDDFDKNKVELLGVELNTKAGNFCTARIPINNLEELFSVNGIMTIEIGEKVYPTLDNARALTNVNQVHNGTGLPQTYTGNGVIVGIIDSGIDYTHPTFRNLNTQQTRISRVWEQTEAGTPPTGLNYGNEIIGASNISTNANDNVNGVSSGSHGTHTTGIAAGSGGISGSSFKGIAYDSEIVLVPTNFTNTGVFNGIQYIFNYATSVSKPAVVNMSLGSQIGPHDGTSTFDQLCNNIVGPGKILVGSAGNDGSNNLHLGKVFSTSSNTLLSYVNFNDSNSTAGISSFDIWGEVGKNFSVAVNVYNINTNTYEAYTPYINTSTGTSTSTTQNFNLYDADVFVPDLCTVQVTYEKTNNQNNKPHVQLYINNSLQDDNYRYILIEVTSTNGVVNTWCTKCSFKNLTYLSPVQNGDTNMTVTETGGTGNSIISVGAYTSNNSYTNISNSNPALDFPGSLGSIAAFSSIGPTVDGRVKPDITAPGNVVVSSVNHFDNKYLSGGSSWNNVVSGLTDNTNNWYFAAMQGTSMAAPVVTGIVALWLQAKPNLTVAQINTILHTTSITDNFTGTGSYIPNNIYGWGKINAYSGIQYINQFLNLDTFNSSNNFIVFPNPTSSKIYITSKEYVGNYEIFNTVGQKIIEGSFNSILDEKELDLSSLQSGLYILNFNGENSNKSIRIIKQ